MIRDKRAFIAKFQAVFALVILVTIIAIRQPGFLSSENVITIVKQITINLCLSLGMTLVILTGGIDLSVGSILGLAGAAAALALDKGLALEFLGVRLVFTVTGAMIAALVVGGAAGLLNGLIITRLNVPSFIATLGMLTIARGLTNRWMQHEPISMGKAFDNVYYGTFDSRYLHVPVPVWIAGLLSLLFILVTLRTRFGRYVYAIGGNERAATLSGLPVRRVKLLVYTLSGMMAAVGGLILTSKLATAEPGAGMYYELDSIAAVVIGGTSLSGGRGSILGTILGCLLIGVLSNGLDFLGVPSDWQQVLKGLVIVAAAAIDQRNAKAA